MICTRCIYDDRIPYISFDADGVCNYCHQHDELEKEYPTGDEGRARLKVLAAAIAEEGRGKKYDVVIGVSGGTDSSYMLHLAKELGLRPLAAHFDNTWNSRTAVENISRVLGKLNIDLFTHVVDNREYCDIFRSFLLASVPDVDIPSDIGLATTHYLAAEKFGIRYIFEGHSFRTEGITPHGWVYMDARYIQTVQQQFGSMKLKTFPNLWMGDWLRWTALRRIRKIRPLYYVDYRKEDAKKFLAGEFGWEWYGGHHMENRTAYFANNYYLPRKFGIDLRYAEFSALVRTHQLSREDALAQIAVPKPTDPSIIDEIKKRLSLSDADFNDIMAAPHKSYRDYRTYKQRFERLRWLFWRSVQDGPGPEELLPEIHPLVRRREGRTDHPVRISHHDERPLRVMVTGADGYLGGVIADTLVAHGAEVVRLHRLPGPGADVAVDLSHPDAGRQLAAISDVGAVVHCAAVFPPNVPERECLVANPAMARTVGGWATECGVRRVVHLSSTSVYAPGASRVGEADTSRPAGPYGESKRQAELALDRAALQGGFSVAHLRIAAPRRSRDAHDHRAEALRAGGSRRPTAVRARFRRAPPGLRLRDRYRKRRSVRDRRGGLRRVQRSEWRPGVDAGTGDPRVHAAWPRFITAGRVSRRGSAGVVPRGLCGRAGTRRTRVRGGHPAPRRARVVRPRLAEGGVMRLAILSDVHANLPALISVLASVPRVDHLVFCGDAVGYYPDPNEVCALLSERRAIAVRGNHDAIVLGELLPEAGAESLIALDWTRSALSKENRAWLAAAPDEQRIRGDGVEIIIRHASPWDLTTYLHRDSPALTRVALEPGQWLLVGHTHRPMVRPAGAGMLVNPGSVGQPRDEQAGASFALLDVETGEVEVRRVAYDVDRYCARLESMGWHPLAIAALRMRQAQEHTR